MMDVYLKVILAKLKRRKKELEAELQPFVNSCSSEEWVICGRLEEIENLIIYIEGEK